MSFFAPQAENSLKAQIHDHLQDLERLTASLNAELQNSRRYEEELRELREQHVQHQNKMKSLESRASQLKESSSHSQELARQIEVGFILPKGISLLYFDRACQGYYGALS